jgi:hypothetical protein
VLGGAHCRGSIDVECRVGVVSRGGVVRSSPETRDRSGCRVAVVGPG